MNNKATPRVYNKHHKHIPSDAVYIGRGSPYGNPFVIPKDGDRDQVCEKFEEYLHQNKDLIQLIKDNLKGKSLICFCSPKRCHGDTILRIANEQ